MRRHPESHVLPTLERRLFDGAWLRMDLCDRWRMPGRADAALQRKLDSHDLCSRTRLRVGQRRELLGNSHLHQRKDVQRMRNSAWLHLDRTHLDLRRYAQAVQLLYQFVGLFGADRMHVEQCHACLRRHARHLFQQRQHDPVPRQRMLLDNHCR